MMIASVFSSGPSATSLVGQVELLILLLIVTLLVALLARLMRVPYTLLLVIVGFLVGIGIGLFPILPHEHLDPNVVLYIFIPALLFEGAWNAELDRLEAEWLPIILLVLPGVVLSILVVAVALHLGIGMEWLLALLVGTIVAPTDPVAVIALFHQLGVPDRLRILVEGESIFNDGTGGAAYELVLAVLLPLLGLAEVSGEPSFHTAPVLGIIAEVLWLIFGGFLLGLGIGWLVSHLLRRIDDRLVVITITIAVAYGMYLRGTAVSTSGLLAVVGAGLVMGSYGRKHAMSVRTIETADDVWEFIDYLANSLLFLLLGFELALTNLVQSFPGILFGVLGALIGRMLMIYSFVPLQDVLARWLAHRTLERSPRFSHPRPIPSLGMAFRDGAFRTAWSTLARFGAEPARSARATEPAYRYCLWRDLNNTPRPGADPALLAASLERPAGSCRGRGTSAQQGLNEEHPVWGTHLQHRARQDNHWSWRTYNQVPLHNSENRLAVCR